MTAFTTIDMPDGCIFAVCPAGRASIESIASLSTNHLGNDVTEKMAHLMMAQAANLLLREAEKGHG